MDDVAQLKRLLTRHPRFHLHVIPTSSSWLDLVERWFRDITDKWIRWGMFNSVHDLTQVIHASLNNPNQNPTRSSGASLVERILGKIEKGNEALEILR